MTLERINPESLGRPSGFAHAVRATDSARVYLAGQTALDSTGAIVGSVRAGAGKPAHRAGCRRWPARAPGHGHDLHR